MRRIAAICAIFAISAASYDNPSDPSPDAVQAFNPSMAPDPVCRSNEEFSQCATHCEPTCYNPNPVCIRSCAPAQCQCVYGYVRNDYGECVSGNSCPTTTTTEEPVQETTTEAVYSTEAPATEEPAPVTEEPAPQYVNTPLDPTPTIDEEPTTTTEEPTTTEYYEPAPTEAPAPVDPYAPEETPAAQTETDSTPDQTAAPSTDYAQSAPNAGGESTDAAPAPEDEDVVVVGGSCGENTCRVGFRCDDSTAVGAKCIPFDTRARSSCSAVRCRPGWSCVIAMDGPRCYRNSVLGVTEAPYSPTGPELTGPPAPETTPVPASSDYAADAPPDANASPFSSLSCADTICPFGLTCFEGDSFTPEPFCRSNTEGRNSVAQLCQDVQCGPNESCADKFSGPVCLKNAPATCAATSCLVGSECVEHPEGARCEAPSGPQVFPGKTCADTACPDMHQCFDTVDGASCYPIPTDPIEPNEPLKCAQMTCSEGEECNDDEHGGICRPAQYATAAPAPASEEPAPEEAPAPAADEPQARSGSSSDCEHTSCGAGEHCAVSFEGTSYCRKNEGDASNSVSSDPTIPVPLCSQITCPAEHQCFDDAVKGAACWPNRDADPVTSPTVTVRTPESRRGAAPGYRRRF